MRLAFAILVLLFIASITWALWEDAFPEWRRYQRELHRREIVRMENELEDARSVVAPRGDRRARPPRRTTPRLRR